jgi:hypothetical protein
MLVLVPPVFMRVDSDNKYSSIKPDADNQENAMRAIRIYGNGHAMIGTVLMLFFGLPSITLSL